MRAIVQRVSQAHVVVHGAPTGSIKTGLCVLIGIGKNDKQEYAKQLAYQIAHLRVFSDEFGKMQHSVQGIKGSVLVVSQFTLYADTKEGNRPSFVNAAPPKEAKELYHSFIDELSQFVPVETGAFGTHMVITMVADGPVTIMLEETDKG